LITQSDEMKKLYFISPALSKFLYADSGHHLNIINMGVALFHRNSSKYSSNSECIFRISQDGLLNLIPYMSKRLVFASTVAQFKYFLMNKNIEVDSISEEWSGLRKDIDDMTTGCFILAVKIQETLVEGIVMHKFPKSVNMMVSRENIFSLHLRYLSKAERESVAVAFELDK